MACRRKYEEWIGNSFGKYGKFVASGKYRPWIVMTLCIVVNLGLSIGILRLETLSDIEELYTPQNSEASKNRKDVDELFPSKTGTLFNQYALSDLGLYGEIIVRTENDVNILNSSIIDLIQVIDGKIRTEIIVNDDTGKKFNFSDICAIFAPRGCVVDGEIIFSPQFRMHINNITYPSFQNQRIERLFGNVNLREGILLEASMVKLRYNLRDGTYSSLSKEWEKQFEEKVSSFSEKGLEIAFIHSNSRNTELDSSTTGDIKYFSVTFTLMITYASIASIGLNLNTVAWRPLLSLGGVLATILAIGSAFGFASLIGIKFVSIVGAMPFLVIGIGLDDVFILMSGVADACSDPSVPEVNPIAHKLYLTLKGSGIAITITSLTDFIAFGIGASSVFLSVRNFCITTGVAVLFCYFNQLFFFVPCLIINERRVEETRHFFFCHKRVRPKDEDKNNRSSCSILCCSGHKPVKRDEFDGALEKFPKIIIKTIIRKIPLRIMVLLLFLAYLGVSIYGAVNLKQGLELRNLATTDSYYYKYTTLDDTYFREDIPISFVIRSSVDYTSVTVRNQMESLIRNATQEENIISSFEINWLASFQNSSFYNTTSESAFVSSLQSFLNTASGFIFRTDVVFDNQNSKILASRSYVFSNDVKTSTEQGNLMLRIREIASQSSLPVFAYSPAFIFYEQYVQILPATLQTVGIAIAVMFVITTIFMPQPIMVILVIVTMIMILVGIFGFMYFWNLTLSSITMIHLVMTVGFSVDFSAHICHAYLSVIGFEPHSNTKGNEERQERVEKAIDRSGGPIINAALSSIVGILMLTLSTSYIFQSFFKLMLLVILFGLAHSVFLLPIILLFLGPTYNAPQSMPREMSIIIPSTESSKDLKRAFTTDQFAIPPYNATVSASLHEIRNYNKIHAKLTSSIDNLRTFSQKCDNNEASHTARENERKTAKRTYNPEFRAEFYQYS